MPDTGSDVAEGTRRPVLLAVAVGIAVALAAIGIILSIIAIPFFALARFADPGNGLDQPFVRTGLIKVALPAGAVLGTLAGVFVGRWYRKGGRLPAE